MTPGDEPLQGGAAQVDGGTASGDASAPASGPMPGYDVGQGGSGGGAGRDSGRAGSGSDHRPDSNRHDEAQGSDSASDAFNARACGRDSDRQSDIDGRRTLDASVSDLFNLVAIEGSAGSADMGTAHVAHGDIQADGSNQNQQQFDQFKQQSRSNEDQTSPTLEKTQEVLNQIQVQEEKNRVYRDLGEERREGYEGPVQVSRDEVHEWEKNRREQIAVDDSSIAMEQSDVNPRLLTLDAKDDSDLNVSDLLNRIAAETGSLPPELRRGIRRDPGHEDRHRTDDTKPDMNKPSAAPKGKFLPGPGGHRLSDGKNWNPRPRRPSETLRDIWNGGKWLKAYKARLAETSRMMGAKKPLLDSL